MKGLLKIFTPQSIIGKLGLWTAFFMAGMYFGAKLVDPCPPTTSIQIDQKNKVKKGSTMNSNLTGVVSEQDFIERLRSLSMKEIKTLRK